MRERGDGVRHRFRRAAQVRLGRKWVVTRRQYRSKKQVQRGIVRPAREGLAIGSDRVYDSALFVPAITECFPAPRVVGPTLGRDSITLLRLTPALRSSMRETEIELGIEQIRIEYQRGLRTSRGFAEAAESTVR